MKIIIVGCGKVGSALAQQLSDEKHNVTVVDLNAAAVQYVTESCDVMGITGNGTSISVLMDAGLEKADVLIAVTGLDALNLLCCIFAKKAGHCHAIARVRNPVYSQELDFIKKQYGITAIINPELAAAREISRLLQFPAADKVDTFADGRVSLVKLTLPEGCPIENTPLKNIFHKVNCRALICAVERNDDVVIPSGDFVLQAGDSISILASKADAYAFVEKLEIPNTPARSAMIIGGGTIGDYLARDLLDKGMRLRIIEKKEDRCRKMAEELPGASIICGDGTEHSLLESEGLANAEAFISLTNMDEENIMLSLYASKHSKAKLITKVNRLEMDDLVAELHVGSVIYPKYMTRDFITQQVRALQNAAGNNLKTMYRILDDRVETLEFTVTSDVSFVGKPISSLRLKPNLLICCITRGDDVIIPGGGDCIQEGDSVIVATLTHGLTDIRSIVR